MNSITVFCEHSNKDTIGRLKTIVKYATDRNLKFIKLNQLDKFFNDKLGGNYALLTFDDGQEYKYDEIVPFLRENKIQAICFAIPLHFGFHDLYTNFDYYIRNKDVFEVGSHSLTHTMVVQSTDFDGNNVTSPKLIYYGDKNLKATYNYGLIARAYDKMKGRMETDLEFDRRIDRELSFSKEWIERAMGQECRFFAYPYGVYDDCLVDKIKMAGYKMAFTVNRTNENILTVPRIDSTTIGCDIKQHVIGEVVVNACNRLSQNDIDVKYGIYK